MQRNSEWMRFNGCAERKWKLRIFIELSRGIIITKIFTIIRKLIKRKIYECVWMCLDVNGRR